MVQFLETLASYVPHLVIRHLADDPTPLLEPTSYEIRAAVLFADVSGFSTLADRLAERGPDGAEALSETLNGVFNELIALITALGGDIVTFAGDALLALWPATDEDLTIAIRRASQCSLALQALFHDERVSERVQLAVRMGIGAGNVQLLHIGGVNGRWIWTVAGDPLLQAAHASYDAEPGRVVLSSDTWALVEDQYGGHVHKSGSVRLDAILSYMLPVREMEDPPLVPAMEAALRGYIPRGVLARLTAGQESWLGELRRVTVLFISLPDLHQSTTPLDKAQLAVYIIQSIVYRYEGHVNKLSLDEKGATLVAALGLPPMAHEDDAVRGLQVSLAIQEALREQAMSCSIGIATGQVFCGEVGNEQRREYTMLGTVVNLAARLMQAAQESILCDAATYQLSLTRITFDTLPPIKVKGREHKVVVYRPHGEMSHFGAPHKALIGRTAERKLLTEHLHSLLQGFSASSSPDEPGEEQPSPENPSTLIFIEGETGMGKTYLIDDLYRQAKKQGIKTLLGTGDVMEQMTPYYAWRAVFVQLFELEHVYDGLTQRSRIEHKLEHAPDLLPLIPLLNMVLPFDMPDTERTRQLKGQARSATTQCLLVQLLRETIAWLPGLLVLQDAQWLDADSWVLARAVSEQITPLLFVITLRPQAASLHPDYDKLQQMPQTRRIQLHALSQEETAALLARRLGVAAVPERLTTLICEQTQGNPLFSEELIYTLRDAGLVQVVQGGCHIAAEDELVRALRASDTVQAAITRRMDRLSPTQQLTLKVASVIGHAFSLRMLLAIHPLQADIRALNDDIAALQDLNLIQRDEGPLEYCYRFAQVVTQEVVYSMMAFAQRRQVHRAIAEWYEYNHPDRLDEFAPLIGRHFEQAGDSRAFRYFLRAGNIAWEAYVYQEALQYYERALDIFTRYHAEPDSTWYSPELLLLLFVRRGQALEYRLCYDEALQNYQQMEELALRRRDKALRQAALLARARLHTLPSPLYDPLRSQAVLESALVLAHQQADDAAQTHILGDLMRLNIFIIGNQRQAALYGERGLTLARECDLREQQAYTLHDLALAYRITSGLAHSVQALEEARDLWQQQKKLSLHADTLARLALHYFLQGSYDQALQTAHHAYRTDQTSADTGVQASSRLVVGAISLEWGQVTTALRTLEEAISLAEQAGHLPSQIATRAQLAWAYGLLGENASALALGQAALAQAEASLPQMRAWPLAVLARLCIRQGKLDEAEAALHYRYVDLMLDATALFEPMLTALAEGELALARHDYLQTLATMDNLMAYLQTSGSVAFRVDAALLKSQALLGLGQEVAAYEMLQQARATAEAQQARLLLWPVLLLLGSIARQRGNSTEAQHCSQQAQRILDAITHTIENPGLRASFLAAPPFQMVSHSEYLRQALQRHRKSRHIS